MCFIFDTRSRPVIQIPSHHLRIVVWFIMYVNLFMFQYSTVIQV